MTKYPVKVVPKITSKDETAHRKKCYLSAHIKADTAEKNQFGLPQFNYLNREIQKLPKNHWAATHTPNHRIHISQELLNLIPPNQRAAIKAELKLHEITEDKIMSKKKR